MNAEPERLSTLELPAAELVRSHPPVWRDANKKVIAALSCPADAEHRGQIRVTRWRAGALPETLPESSPALEAHADLFGYAPAPASETHWYLNFADRRLFIAYGSGLLAQDELQVAEHPALGSVAEAMAALPDQVPLTAEDEPTPILVAGVERRCVLDTAPDLDAGRVYGLYGHRFQRATPDEVRGAVTVLDPPTVSNILAIEAPTAYRGAYTAKQIRFILRTAVAGYRAAALESAGSLVIHTGFWGCGAYGGNRELMALLQILAARIAGVSRLVFHAFDSEGLALYRAGEAVAAELAGLTSLEQAIAVIVELGYQWGVSDGN